ncbi:MAG: hypothetical protein M9947_09370 [Thermomicrobiales bacterium]|nr:hypothetical protein [Thermomicrobiales bacterium]
MDRTSTENRETARITLLVLSFLSIPVRCDVSAAPHSIFVDPPPTSTNGDHRSHAVADRGSAVAHEKHVPGHSVDPNAAQEPDRCVVAANPGADPGSQAPVSSSLDLPVTTAPPVTEAPFDQDGAGIVLLGNERAALIGIAVSPDSPPPRFAA